MVKLLAPGDVIADRFQVLHVIGAGGMGVVMAARNLQTGGEVALKCIHPSASSAEHSERLRREAQAAARIRHVNVVTVFDVVEHENQIVLVMELLSGKTLEHYLETQPPYLEELLLLLRDAMQGVLAAHECGVIHRDIKPANIFLNQGPHQRHAVVKVLDFGVSKFADPNSGPITQTGALIGTLCYMSPEQLGGSRDVDHRTDVYSFGVILYEAVTGRLPFVGTPAAVISRSLTSFPPPPISLCPELPLELNSLILKAMHPEPGLRYGSMGVLIDAVDELLQSETVRSRSSLLRARPPMLSTLAAVYRSGVGGTAQGQAGLAPFGPSQVAGATMLAAEAQASGGGVEGQGSAQGRKGNGSWLHFFAVGAVIGGLGWYLWTSAGGGVERPAAEKGLLQPAKPVAATEPVSASEQVQPESPGGLGSGPRSSAEAPRSTAVENEQIGTGPGTVQLPLAAEAVEQDSKSANTDNHSVQEATQVSSTRAAAQRDAVGEPEGTRVQASEHAAHSAAGAAQEGSQASRVAATGGTTSGTRGGRKAAPARVAAEGDSQELTPPARPPVTPRGTGKNANDEVPYYGF